MLGFQPVLWVIQEDGGGGEALAPGKHAEALVGALCKGFASHPRGESSVQRFRDGGEFAIKASPHLPATMATSDSVTKLHGCQAKKKS